MGKQGEKAKVETCSRRVGSAILKSMLVKLTSNSVVFNIETRCYRDIGLVAILLEVRL